MICHVVLIRLRPDVTPARAETFLEEARNVLGPIPGVRNLRVGRGMGVKADADFPVALVMDFADERALEAYQVHDEHRRFVEEIVGPIQEDKKVFDYVC